MAVPANVANEVSTGKPRSRVEVDATVADYFQMLRLELFGQKFNKSLHRRELLKRLAGRSEGAIEMKHQNISAVLMELGAMPLTGYKALPNYQQLLVESVAAQLVVDEALDRAALSAVELPAEMPSVFSFDSFVTERPAAKPYRVGDERIECIKRAPIKRDYLAREAQNRALGLAGEQLVLEYEARRLHELGNKALADRVEHISKTQGDGCGYDVLSFDADGRERFIEVKTTAFSAETPFFVSQNEISFSDHASDQFQLYRLFEFRNNPRMFQLRGPVATNCRRDPATYRASLL